MAGHGHDAPAPFTELSPAKTKGNRAKRVKEHKRANALNLGPGLSKSNDGLGNALSSVKDSSRGSPENAESIKKEVESSLDERKPAAVFEGSEQGVHAHHRGQVKDVVSTKKELANSNFFSC